MRAASARSVCKQRLEKGCQLPLPSPGCCRGHRCCPEVTLSLGTRGVGACLSSAQLQEGWVSSVPLQRRGWYKQSARSVGTAVMCWWWSSELLPAAAGAGAERSQAPDTSPRGCRGLRDAKGLLKVTPRVRALLSGSPSTLAASAGAPGSRRVSPTAGGGVGLWRGEQPRSCLSVPPPAGDAVQPLQQPRGCFDIAAREETRAERSLWARTSPRLHLAAGEGGKVSTHVIDELVGGECKRGGSCVG